MMKAGNTFSFQDLDATRVIATTIGPAQRFWAEGHEPAFTIIPNYMITGILSVIMGLAIVVWSIRFLPARHGRTV